MFDIISIGTATRDVYLQSPFFKVLKDTKHLQKLGFPTGEAECFAMGGKIDISDVFFTTGGGAVNTAVTFARQKLKTGALITVGNDKNGEEVLRELKREKVTPLAIVNKGQQTGYSTILLSAGGERTILSYRDEDGNLTKKKIPFSRMQTKWAYIAPGTIDIVTLTALVKQLTTKKTLIAINPSKHFISIGPRKLKPLLDNIKVVIMNREEASYFTGVAYEKIETMFVKLHNKIPGIAVMTDGPHGVLVSDGFNIYKAGVFKEKKVVDRTGAGDAFGSAFIAGLIERGEECRLGLCDKENIKYAIRLASANATSKVEHRGAKGGLLTAKEFETSPRWKKLDIEVWPL